MTLAPSKIPEKRNSCCERLVLALRQTDKKHTHNRPQVRINFGQNTQFLLLFVVGWV